MNSTTIPDLPVFYHFWSVSLWKQLMLLSLCFLCGKCQHGFKLVFSITFSRDLQLNLRMTLQSKPDPPPWPLAVNNGYSPLSVSHFIISSLVMPIVATLQYLQRASVREAYRGGRTTHTVYIPDWFTHHMNGHHGEVIFPEVVGRNTNAHTHKHSYNGLF